jgi:hypothetical protein
MAVIAKTKEVAAYKALQQLIICGRTMAHEGADHSAIADLMDTTEYLAAMLYDPRDMTAAFRANLVELTKLHGCSLALSQFDAG